MVLKERYFSRFEVRWYLEIVHEAIFLFELEKTGSNNPKENPTTAMGRLGFLVIN